MPMKSQRHAVTTAFDPEQFRAAGIEQTIGHKLVDRTARLKGGVQLNERFRPQQARCEIFVDTCPDASVPDRDEALGVLGVVADYLIAQMEDVQSPTLVGASRVATLEDSTKPPVLQP